MFCKNCGSQLDNNALFCGNCGTSVKSEVNTSQGSNSSMNNSSNNGNMKNALIILLICGVVIFLAVFGYTKIFGSSVKSSAKKIEAALNNTSRIESGTIGVNLEFDASYDDENISFGLDASFDVDFKNTLASLNLNVNAMDISVNVPAYLDFNDENAVLYFKVPEALTNSLDLPIGWNKITLGTEFEDFEIDDDTFFVIEDFAKTSDVIELVESDKNFDKYIIHFNRELLEQLDEDDNDFDISVLEEVGLENGFDLGLVINKKDNYVTELSLDLSSIEYDGVLFDKFIMSFTLTNLNKLDKIEIPIDAYEANELEYGSLYDDSLYDDDIIYDEEYYEDDYKLTYDGFTINYNLPDGYVASSVNDSDFKIYRKDGIRVIATIDYDNKDEFFLDVAEEKESYISYGYTNVTLSDIKELTYKDKTFYYQIMEYTSDYGNDYYEVYLCYELSDKYVYSVTFEDEDHTGLINEDMMKDFLDINVD